MMKGLGGIEKRRGEEEWKDTETERREKENKREREVV